jgi:transcriptional regulator with XRE-family HTH domain
LWPLADLSVKDYKQYGGVSTSIALRFGKRLRELRKKRGWTQVRLAEEMGIDRSYISDMERGKKNVCLPTMEILAQGFEITLAQLMNGLERNASTASR